MVDSSISNVAASILGLTLSGTLFLVLLGVIIGFLGLFTYWFLLLFWKPQCLQKKKRPGKRIKVQRMEENPVMRPIANHWWESESVLNPAAVVDHGKVHLFYRAMGKDGISRLGYAWSDDGINFERLPHPVYEPETASQARRHWPNTSPARLTYDTVTYSSGGGWGGCEDPRGVIIDDTLHLTFNIFNGWHTMRVGCADLGLEDLDRRHWNWSPLRYLSRPGERQKNWILFPEKINGKYALFYNLDKGDPSRVHIAYLDKIDDEQTPRPDDALDPQKLPDHHVAWHYRTRSAAAPPIKTARGWILLYHAMEHSDPNRYKLGAMLLDLNDPTKVLSRTSRPILEPDAWYENDWKPGIIYVTGAIVLGEDLIIYYGGGDKYIAAAKINLNEFLDVLESEKIPASSLFSRALHTLTQS